MAVKVKNKYPARVKIVIHKPEHFFKRTLVQNIVPDPGHFSVFRQADQKSPEESRGIRF